MEECPYSLRKLESLCIPLHIHLASTEIWPARLIVVPNVGSICKPAAWFVLLDGIVQASSVGVMMRAIGALMGQAPGNTASTP